MGETGAWTLLRSRQRLCECVVALREGRPVDPSYLEEALEGMWRDDQQRTWNAPGPLPRFAEWLENQWPTFLVIEERVFALVARGVRPTVIGAITDARETGLLPNSVGPWVRVDGEERPDFAIPGWTAAWIARLILWRRPELAGLIDTNSAQCDRPSAGSLFDLPLKMQAPGME